MDSELERISSDEETDTILREFIASARISRREPLWTFCALDCTDPAIQSHIHTLKDYWRPHGDRLEIPEEWSVRTQSFSATVDSRFLSAPHFTSR
jgi:hypothetical protein